MRVTTSDYGCTNSPVLGVAAKKLALSNSIRKRTPPKQASIDGRLRDYYDSLLREPAPRRLVDLVEALARAKDGIEPPASSLADQFERSQTGA